MKTSWLAELIWPQKALVVVKGIGSSDADADADADAIFASNISRDGRACVKNIGPRFTKSCRSARVYLRLFIHSKLPSCIDSKTLLSASPIAGSVAKALLNVTRAAGFGRAAAGSGRAAARPGDSGNIWSMAGAGGDGDGDGGGSDGGGHGGDAGDVAQS